MLSSALEPKQIKFLFFTVLGFPLILLRDQFDSNSSTGRFGSEATRHYNQAIQRRSNSQGDDCRPEMWQLGSESYVRQSIHHYVSRSYTLLFHLTEKSDPWWNTCVENQALGRVLRLGQLKDAFLTRIVVANSIDSRIVECKPEIEERRCIFTNKLCSAKS